VLDVEILQNMIAFLTPPAFSEADLGFEAIGSVQAGGHFFGAEHTMSRYETAFYRPLLSDWTNYEGWEAAGAKDALARATELWQEMLATYQEPPLDPARREALEAYVAKRREEIGAGEP
jgi:trimethylamine--corrinoid protein Co-methyltransferase